MWLTLGCCTGGVTIPAVFLLLSFYLSSVYVFCQTYCMYCCLIRNSWIFKKTSVQNCWCDKTQYAYEFELIGDGICEINKAKELLE